MELIHEENLSVAWAKAFCKAMSTKGGNILPLIVKITGFSEKGVVDETKEIRNLLEIKLDSKLKNNLYKKKVWLIETTSDTIFPKTLWNKKIGREELYKCYLDSWPLIKKEPLNRKGTYFYRMINFENGKKVINQLEHVITTWNIKSNRRKTALQAAIFNPCEDHVHQIRLGFPCLQQVAFNPLGVKGIDGLSVVGFYPTQLLFERGYGNYLGLCRLGEFMAQEMNLELKQMLCIITSANAYGSDTLTKKEGLAFAEQLKETLISLGHNDI